MSFSDIFKTSFFEAFTNVQTDTSSLLVRMALSVVFGFFIFLIYRIITKKTFYNNSFNFSLVAMSVITAAIILTIQSNIVLSLGMVGALSIVRFRTAIKDPLDLVFLYWALSVGIICGAGLTLIAVILSLGMAVIVFIVQKYPFKKASMILVVNSSIPDNDEQIVNVAKEFSKYCDVKSRNLTPDSLNMIIEVKTEKNSELVHKIMEIPGMTSASLISHDGEITA